MAEETMCLKEEDAMICKKLASLAVATMIGAALIAAPAQARFGGGGGGMRGGGGFAVAHVGGFGGFRGGGFVRGPAFVGRSAFIGRSAFVNRAFFPGRRFVAPFFGVGALYAGYSSCWTWVPTAFGWRRVWACNFSYGYGDGYY
jgi:hypothetical protein